MKKSKILSIHESLKNNSIDVSNILETVHLNQIKLEGTNSILTKCVIKNEYDKFHFDPNNLLSCIPYSLKDNISTSEFNTTGGSKFLKNYLSPFDATVYKIIKSQGAILTSKDSLDEFGMAGTGLFCFSGEVKNFLDQSRIAGGSSSGSINTVASGAAVFSIGTDTGDSVRRPASFLGVVGYKPTYGLISRYGVLPYSPSLDHLGIITTSVIDAAIVASYIFKHDEKDFTSQKLNSSSDLYKNLKIQKNLVIGIIDGIEKHIGDDESKLYLESIEKIKRKGFKILKFKLEDKFIDLLGPVYQTISNIEGISCYSNFTGITFGDSTLDYKNYQDMILKNRTNAFNSQVKKRFLLGAYVTQNENFEKLFIAAKKTRRFIVNKFNEILDNVDCLLIPGASSIAPTIEFIKSKTKHTTYADLLLILANFAGSPSITINCGYVKKLPFGLNFNCKQFEDQKLLNIAYTMENVFEEDKNE